MKLLNWIIIAITVLISKESYGGDIPHSQNAISIEECIQLALLNSNAIKIQNSTQQINELNLASSLHSIKPSFSISFSPLYNQSINSVTQPDGSIRNIGVQHASGLLSFNTSIPLSLTGGNISISQSVNYYRYINRNSSYENFGVNLYQVSYSQPLSFFRRNKFIKQTAISNYKLKTLKKFPEILNIKKEVIDCYFDLLIYQENIQLLDSILDKYEIIKVQYENLYKSGKCLLVDLESLILGINEIGISKKKIQNNCDNKIRMLKNVICQDIPGELLNFYKPTIIEYQFNDQYLHHRLDSIQASYMSLIESATEQQLAEAKVNLIDLPTITFGIGTNTSFENFSQFRANLNPSYNISISYSINLTDLKENKRKMRMALINKNIFIEELEMKNKKERIYLDELLGNINVCYDQSRFLSQSLSINLHSLDVKEKLLEAQRITLTEFNEQIKNLTEINTEIINNIREYYINIAQLGCLIQLEAPLIVEKNIYYNCDYVNRYDAFM